MGMNRGPSIADQLQGGKEAADYVRIMAGAVRQVCALTNILAIDTAAIQGRPEFIAANSFSPHGRRHHPANLQVGQRTYTERTTHYYLNRFDCLIGG
jgi:hypothetical protein